MYTKYYGNTVKKLKQNKWGSSEIFKEEVKFDRKEWRDMWLFQNE